MEEKIEKFPVENNVKLNLKVNPQLLTSFPNDNNKQIDNVIVYDKLQENNDPKVLSKIMARRAFFKKLNQENVNVFEIEQTIENKTRVYSLLNCSMDRLLEEAELIRLEMILKDVS